MEHKQSPSDCQCIGFHLPRRSHPNPPNRIRIRSATQRAWALDLEASSQREGISTTTSLAQSWKKWNPKCPTLFLLKLEKTIWNNQKSELRCYHYSNIYQTPTGKLLQSVTWSARLAGLFSCSKHHPLSKFSWQSCVGLCTHSKPLCFPKWQRHETETQVEPLNLNPQKPKNWDSDEQKVQFLSLRPLETTGTSTNLGTSLSSSFPPGHHQKSDIRRRPMPFQSTFEYFWCVFFGWNKCLIFDQFERCLKLSTQNPTPCSATLMPHGSWTAVSSVCQVSVSRIEIADSLHFAKYLPESYAEKRWFDFTTPTSNQTRDFKNPLNDGSIWFILLSHKAEFNKRQFQLFNDKAMTGQFMGHLPS